MSVPSRCQVGAQPPSGKRHGSPLEARCPVSFPLSLKAGELVKVIVLLENQPHPASPVAVGRKLRQDWAGGLAELAAEFTSVELQHKASEWRDN